MQLFPLYTSCIYIYQCPISSTHNPSTSDRFIIQDKQASSTQQYKIKCRFFCVFLIYYSIATGHRSALSINRKHSVFCIYECMDFVHESHHPLMNCAKVVRTRQPDPTPLRHAHNFILTKPKNGTPPISFTGITRRICT